MQARLGEAIRNLRLERGVSQEEFASVCGLHRTYIGSVERGERNVSLANIIRIADSLYIKASRLLEIAEL